MLSGYHQQVLLAILMYGNLASTNYLVLNVILGSALHKYLFIHVYGRWWFAGKVNTSPVTCQDSQSFYFLCMLCVCVQEQAVLKKMHRSATVVSHTTTELLCLDSQDLAEMYICGRATPIKDKEILHFLCNLYFLKDFPLDLLHIQPQALIFHYFQ